MVMINIGVSLAYIASHRFESHQGLIVSLVSEILCTSGLPYLNPRGKLFVGLGQNTGHWGRRKGTVLVAPDRSSYHGGVLRGKTGLTPSTIVIVATHNHVVSTVMGHVVRHRHRRDWRNALR